MHRREFLKFGLGLGVLPVIGASASGTNLDPIDGIPRLSPEARSVLADRKCEVALNIQLNVPSDEQTWESLVHLEDAARLGQPFAMWMLSTRYWEGWRAPLRRTDAVHHCIIAAADGEFIAALEMSLRYKGAYGVRESRETAETWWQIACPRALHQPLSEMECLRPREVESWYPLRGLRQRIIRDAKHLWNRETSNGSDPHWHTSVASESLLDLARLKRHILQAKRFSNPDWTKLMVEANQWRWRVDRIARGSWQG